MGTVMRLFPDARWFGYAAAVAGVAAVSWVIGLVGGTTHLANISLLYLLVVLGAASFFGSGPAVLAAFVAFLTFNWFFVEPRHTLIVAEPDEFVSLLVFLVTAVVTGQLAANLRRRAAEAEQREQEARRLRQEATEAEVL